MAEFVMPILQSPDIWALTKCASGPRDRFNFVEFKVVPHKHAPPSGTLDDSYHVRLDTIGEGEGVKLLMRGTAFTIYGACDCHMEIDEHSGIGKMTLFG